MGHILQNFPNAIPPDSDYPYGDIKDNPGNGTGTPINRETNADLHQFLARMADKAGITLNDLPDNDYTGFQFFEALEGIIAIKTQKDSLSFGISGGGAVLTTGIKGRRRVPFKCRITGWEMISDVSCTAVMDVWRQNYAGLPATNSESILAGNEMTITGAIKGQNLALTPIDLNEGDWLYYNLDSNNLAKELYPTLIIERVFDPL